jgi:hypothetical protein
MALPTPPRITNPIPNNPFYSPYSWVVDSFQGPLIVGSGLDVDPDDGTMSATPVTFAGVSNLFAGASISVNQPQGDVTVINTGVTSVLAGPNISVSANTGSVVIDAIIPPSVNTVLGTAPITITGTVTTPVVNVSQGSTAAAGVLQLYNNVDSTSNTLALTAAQGKYLQDQISALTLSGSNLVLAGTLDGSTGLVLTVTYSGTAQGFTVGAPLPLPAAANSRYFLILSSAGTFTPPGGAPIAGTVGDWVISDGISWNFLDVGYDGTPATVINAGIVRLSTDAETQVGTSTTTAVTPASLQSKVSDSVSLASSSSIGSSLAVKTVYDLAAAAIPSACMTAKGVVLATEVPGQAFSVVPVQDGYFLESDSTALGGVKWSPTGTVGTISTGTGLTGGPITGTGTIDLTDTGVIPGAGWRSPDIVNNIDAQGRFTFIANGPAAILEQDFWRGQGSLIAGGPFGYDSLAVGSNSQILSIDTTQPLKLKWITDCRGSVSSVATSTGLTGGPITTSGSIALSDTAVVPGSYTAANITVDQKGRITSAQDGSVGVTAIYTGPDLVGGPVTSAGTIDLSTTGVTPGTYTNATITVDSKGRVSNVSSGTGTGAIPCSDLTAVGDLITASAPATPTALPVGNDSTILTANSLCALGIEWANPAAVGGAPGVWHLSNDRMFGYLRNSGQLVTSDWCATNRTDWSPPNFSPSAGSGTAYPQDPSLCSAWYRQVNDQVWEVHWWVCFNEPSTSDRNEYWSRGCGSYVFNLPSEVPGCLYKAGVANPLPTPAGFSGWFSSGNYGDIPYGPMPSVPSPGGFAYRGATSDTWTQSPTPVPFHCRSIRFGVEDDGGIQKFMGCNWYEPANRCAIWSLYAQFQTV